MSLEKQRSFILGCLRNGRRFSPLDEDEVWDAIQRAADSVKGPTERKSDQRRWADEYVFLLGLIYANATDTLPGFTNCQNETRFERFARAVMVEDVSIHVSRNLIKSAIRRLDAKRNPKFMDRLQRMRRRPSEVSAS
jgi:hypothetical protein